MFSIDKNYVKEQDIVIKKLQTELLNKDHEIIELKKQLSAIDSYKEAPNKATKIPKDFNFIHLDDVLDEIETSEKEEELPIISKKDSTTSELDDNFSELDELLEEHDDSYLTKSYEEQNDIPAIIKHEIEELPSMTDNELNGYENGSKDELSSVIGFDDNDLDTIPSLVDEEIELNEPKSRSSFIGSDDEHDSIPSLKDDFLSIHDELDSIVDIDETELDNFKHIEEYHDEEKLDTLLGFDDDEHDIKPVKNDLKDNIFDELKNEPIKDFEDFLDDEDDKIEETGSEELDLDDLLKEEDEELDLGEIPILDDEAEDFESLDLKIDELDDTKIEDELSVSDLFDEDEEDKLKSFKLEIDDEESDINDEQFNLEELEKDFSNDKFTDDIDSSFDFKDDIYDEFEKEFKTPTKTNEKNNFEDEFDDNLDSDELEEIQNVKKKLSTVIYLSLERMNKIMSKLSPKDYIKLINKLFSYISPIIYKNKGNINSFAGESILATFGLFSKDENIENETLNAVNSVLEIQDKIELFNEFLTEKRLEKVTLHCGIHTGNVIVGQLSNKESNELIITGSDAALCKSLEKIAFEKGQFAIISDSTYNNIESKNLSILNLGTINLEDLDQEIEIYSFK